MKTSQVQQNYSKVELTVCVTLEPKSLCQPGLFHSIVWLEVTTELVMLQVVGCEFQRMMLAVYTLGCTMAGCGFNFSLTQISLVTVCSLHVTCWELLYNVLTLSAVIVLIVLAPQFCMRVLGITSKALATALYGHCSTPVIVLAFSVIACQP